MNLISSSSSVSSAASIQERLWQAGISVRNPSDNSELELAIKELARINAAYKEVIAKLKNQVAKHIK